MKRIIRWLFTLLILILGLNIYDIFLKEIDFAALIANNKTVEKPSHRCLNLEEEATFRCLNQVYETGEADSADLFILGQLHLAGLGTEQNLTAAEKLFERSAVEGENPVAMRLLGDINLNQKEGIIAAQYWYQRSARLGDAGAQFKLANLYRYGGEGVQNYAEALKLYKAASDQGNINATYELGLQYGMGLGVEPDLDRALFILEKPCEQGHSDSCALLQRIKELRRP